MRAGGGTRRRARRPTSADRALTDRRAAGRTRFVAARERPGGAPIRTRADDIPRPTSRGACEARPRTARRAAAGIALFQGFDPTVAEKIVATPDIRPAFVEQYRKLAGVLHHAQLEKNLKVVMVTSAMAGEGKTPDRDQPRADLQRVVPALRAADRRRPAPADAARDVPGAEHLGPGRRPARREGAEALAGAGVAAADAADRRAGPIPTR